jgi:hypothetical protein
MFLRAAAFCLVDVVGVSCLHAWSLAHGYHDHDGRALECGRERSTERCPISA